jgi:4-hydroxybenzoate polyprenyltransferase
MTEHASALVTPADSLRRALIHLRLPFSLVLTPLFVWGIYLALPSSIPWGHVLLAYLIIHILLYGGMNAFNSYYDRDEGPIGALLDPPPVNRMVLVVALICKTAALAGGLLLDLRFGLLVAIGIVLSMAYSHPLWRWKERPFSAAVCIFVGQGILGVLWGWTAATWTSGHTTTLSSIWPAGILNTIGVLGAACWTLGFYPLTSVYQIEGDSQRGIRTLAVALGINGCFLFAAAVASLGGLGVWIVLFTRGAYVAMGLSAIYMVGAAYYTWRWYNRFAALSTRENQRKLMRLSYANGLAFTVLFLALIFLSS